MARAGDPGSLAARAALTELCRAYWYPVYAFVRRNGHDADAAFDLTQAFFARLIESGKLAAASAERGRFRAFLLADCRFFLADARDRAHAAKRGGGSVPLSLDARDAETRYGLEPAHLQTPERLFDRAWAVAIIERAMQAVEQHYESTRRADVFRAIRPVLTSVPDPPSYDTIAKQLGTTPGAVQVAVHRARVRIGAELRALVAETLDQPTAADVDDEIRGLFAALAG